MSAPTPGTERPGLCRNNAPQGRSLRPTLLSEEELSKLADLEHGRVHASAYTRSDIFDLELPSVFLGSWLFLGLESEVENPGDFKTVYMADVPVILTRDQGRELIVMLNRCPGCGSTVCQRESGSASAYHCAFHDWYFDSRGALSGVDLRLDRLTRVESYRGLIFACLSATAPGLHQHLGLARRYIDLWADQSPTGEMGLSGGSWKSTYAGNWKLYLQSNGDGYRLEYLRNLARKDEAAPQFIDPDSDPRLTYDLGNGHTFIETDAFDTAWRGRLPTDYVQAVEQRVGPDRTAAVLGFPDWRLQVFPNLCLTRHSLRVLRPISVEETEITQRVTRLPDAPESLNGDILRRASRNDGPAGHRSQDEFEMLERSQHGFRAADAPGAGSGWVYVSKGQASEVRGAHGERIGAVDSEVGVRAPLRAWSALLAGATNVSAVEAPIQVPLPPQAD